MIIINSSRLVNFSNYFFLLMALQLYQVDTTCFDDHFLKMCTIYYRMSDLLNIFYFNGFLSALLSLPIHNSQIHNFWFIMTVLMERSILFNGRRRAVSLIKGELLFRLGKHFCWYVEVIRLNGNQQNQHSKQKKQQK